MYDADIILKNQQPILSERNPIGITKIFYWYKYLLEQIINFFLICLSFILLLLVFPAGD